MTTCPSGVNYMHLVDHARTYIEETYTRPWPERMLRAVLARVLPNPKLFRMSLRAAALARPLEALIPGQSMLAQRLRGMLALAPKSLPAPNLVQEPQVHRAEGERRGRVGLLTGCAQKVLNPEINAATIRLLTRMGIEVVITPGQGCCGALTHHMGHHASAMAAARANIHAWSAEIAGQGLDAIVVNASGCGTTLKDYGFMFREEPDAADAAAVAGLAMDITEVLEKFSYAPTRENPAMTVAYHSACSLQHGQKITTLPKQLLTRAGFKVKEPAESHICCGSAGTYNILQPAIAGQLRSRKLENIRRTQADVIAAGNIGCMTQLAGDEMPVIHTVQLLDWMAGGPKPASLDGFH
jgi:glycolate oxidase iron-sulfur subunit